MSGLHLNHDCICENNTIAPEYVSTGFMGINIEDLSKDTGLTVRESTHTSPIKGSSSLVVGA